MHRYTLQPYKTPGSRYHCPQCRHRSKTFSRYIDTQTNQHLAPHVGRCSREDNCGYHFTPKQFAVASGQFSVGSGQFSVGSSRFSVGSRRSSVGSGQFSVGSKPNSANCQPQTANWQSPANYPLPTANRQSSANCTPQTANCEPKLTRIHGDIANDSFINYHENNFVTYLIKRFGFDTADQLVGRYRIGTSNHWQGATVFWQLDIHGLLRTGKIMLYHAETGKRVKHPYNHITWAHTLLSKQLAAGSSQLSVGNVQFPVCSSQFPVDSSQFPVRSNKTPANCPPPTANWRSPANCPPPTANFHLEQCLFGEHLLAHAPLHQPVAITESEKTAIIGSALMPHLIWLAAGSLHNLQAHKCRVLQGRKVCLFPDVNALDKWQAKAALLRQLMPGTTFTVYTYLEQLAGVTERNNGADFGDVVG